MRETVFAFSHATKLIYRVYSCIKQKEFRMFRCVACVWPGPGPRSLSWIILGPSPGVQHAKKTNNANTRLFHKQQVRLFSRAKYQFFTLCMRTHTSMGCHNETGELGELGELEEPG